VFQWLTLDNLNYSRTSSFKDVNLISMPFLSHEAKTVLKLFCLQLFEVIT